MLSNIAKRSISQLAAAGPASRRSISVQSILHGSPSAKKEGEKDIVQHSRLVGRGKYIHGFETHRVKPDSIEQYKEAAEQYYTGIKNDEQLHVKLTGNWETLIGDQDAFVHILEYENYAGFDKTTDLIAKSPKHREAYKALLPFLTGRRSQLNQEFAFMPTEPPREEGGIFELRSYQLKAGTLLEWESAWRQGIEARSELTRPVGAWFSQVGRLHQVHHLWQYPSLQHRKQMREQAWQLSDKWADTVVKTANVAKFMDSDILVPLSFSPLK